LARQGQTRHQALQDHDPCGLDCGSPPTVSGGRQGDYVPISDPAIVRPNPSKEIKSFSLLGRITGGPATGPTQDISQSDWQPDVTDYRKHRELSTDERKEVEASEERLGTSGSLRRRI